MNLLDLIFPKRCVSCNKIGKYFCDICTAKIKFITHQICPVCEKAAMDGATHPRCKTRYSLDGLTAFFHYDGPIRQAVKQLKYRFVSDLAKEFIDMIPSLVLSTTNYQPPTVLVPIPLHPSRQKFRGFNQAEVLGKLLAAKLKIPVRTNILKRIKKTIPQVEMKDKKKRLINIADVFSIHKLPTTNYPASSADGQPLTILLFDDVFTTGATLRSAANILKRAGAKSVWGIVMAHG